MTNIEDGLRKAIRSILSDIRVEMSEEFDRNFERQGFFAEKWQRRRSPIRAGRPLLIETGDLRRSIRCESTADAITFYTDLPYAAIHNEGGEIKVTRRMKAYFWHRYYEAQGAFGRRKDGSLRQDKRNLRLSTEAEFWRCMALMKVGSSIRIPRRQFLGTSAEVEKAVVAIIERNMSEYFNESDIIKQ